MRWFRGLRLYVFRRKVRRINRGQKLPIRGEKRIAVVLRDVWFYYRWRARRGYIFCGVLDGHDPDHTALESWSFGDERMPVRKRVPSGELPVIPALSLETKILGKCPLLMEWITATAYEDGSVRQPGYFQVRNRTIEFEITVYDPDAGMRIAIRARELDKAFAGVEAILGAVDAPWEPDRYLTSLLPKPKKKK